MTDQVRTIGEALVDGLAARDVTCVFGIPGVHTVELYRGLAASGIRHVTPRHEQGPALWPMAMHGCLANQAWPL